MSKEIKELELKLLDLAVAAYYKGHVHTVEGCFRFEGATQVIEDLREYESEAVVRQTYCMKHYRRIFPDMGCDICKLEKENDKLEKENERLKERICEHEWFRHNSIDNMEQCSICGLWRDAQ